MAKFGENLASGSRLIFWGVVPLGAILLGLMTLVETEWNHTRAVIIGGMDFTFLLLALGLYEPRRFSWALRSVMGIVFLFYCWYVIDQAVFSGHPWRWPLSRGEVNPVKALRGLLYIGIPALVYALRGFAIHKNRGRPSRDGTRNWTRRLYE